MATDGIEGLTVVTRNYGATAAFWSSLGYENAFETGHGSGRWQRPPGGPYVFIVESQEIEPVIQPVLRVANAAEFAPHRAPEFAQEFELQHWGVLEALLRDPDGRLISLQAPAGEPAESHG